MVCTIQPFLLDAYSAEELNYSWSHGRQHATITVMDKHLSEYMLLETESLKDFEYYKDGWCFKCNPLTNVMGNTSGKLIDNNTVTTHYM